MNELMRRILFLPPQGSTYAPLVDGLHYFVISVTMIASGLCGLTALLLYLRYRRRRPQVRTGHVVAGWKFESACVFVPLGLFLLWWAMGFRLFIHMKTPPADSMQVYVTGKQWMWKFAYPGGPSAIEALHVPAGRPVRLLITSRDVIHSFYVPAFRMKQDALPGRYTQIWFEARAPGTYPILCAEMCGMGHSFMLGEVIVHDPVEFEDWLAARRRGLADRQDMGRIPGGPPIADLVEEGRRIASEIGCLKCHSVDGSAHIGPTWLDMYRRRETLSTGEQVIADEAYLTKSIMDPLAEIVAGYAPVMPAYQGQLSAPEIGAMLEYIKTLESAGAPVPSKGPVYEPAPGGAVP